MNTMPSRYGRVAVLYGGESPEREVSLDSGAAVLNALLAEGVDAEGIDAAHCDLWSLPARGIDRVWNALHGGAGEDGTVQGALGLLSLPVTGSGVLASALAMDKLRSKAVLGAHGVRTVGGSALARGAALPTTLRFPVFVKPASGGSSLGAGPVATADALPAAVAAAHVLDPVALVEPLLPGPEYTVGIVGERALPSIRIDADADAAFYDYDAKYRSDDTEFVCPGGDSAFEQGLASQALAAFRALGCSGWGRVDFMLDDEGQPCVLEVNTVPGMTSHSLVPHAARVAGMEFGPLCLAILDSTLAGGVH